MRRVRIFVSSPGDADHERRRVERVVERLNGEFAGVARLEPIRWETEFYGAHQTFQAQIPEAAACDIVVAIFRGRIGTELPTDFARMPDGTPYPSGTAYEVLSAIAARQEGELPDVYVFRSRDPPTVRLDDPEAERVQRQWQRLKAFFDTWFVAAQGPFKAAFHYFASTDDFETQLDRLLRRWLEDKVLHGRAVLWPIAAKGSPFRGLAAFGARHAPVFYGRARDIARAIDDWKDAAARGTPFLLVIGASGSGKSSLARAGLLPRLIVPGVVPTVDLWRVAAMRPTEVPEGPVRALAARLLDAAGDVPEAEAGRPPALPELVHGDYRTEAELAGLLGHGDAAAVAPLLRVLDRIGAEARIAQGYERAVRVDLVLLVDQLDELFGAAVTPGERAAFAAIVRRLVESGRVWVLATLRADLYQPFLAEPDLLALKSGGATCDLAAPGPAELAEIVRKPAEAAELVFERHPQTGERLDERLLRDADRPDMLPLLQLVLNRLFGNRVVVAGETRLAWGAYEELGGLAGIIDREAERAVAGLGEAELAALPRLLRQLVAFAAGDGGQATPTTRSVPLAAATPDTAAGRLVEALVAARILLAAGEGGGATLQLAHQRVLLDWRRARELTAADRDFYRIRDEVEAQRRRWETADERRDLLIPPGLPLAEAEAVLSRFGDELPPESRAFIAASGRRIRIRQRLTAGAAGVFAVLAVVATAAGIAAWQQRQDAIRAQQRAETEQARAERSLDAAKNAVNSLIFDISQGLRDQGIRVEAVRDVLGVVQRTIESLSHDAPDDVGLLGSRGEMLNEFAATYLAIGDLANSRKSAEAALAIFTQLSTRFPSEAAWQNNLLVSLSRLADAAIRMGDLAAARTAIDDGLARIEALEAHQPNDRRWRQDRSIALERRGDLQQRTGDVNAALASFREGLAIRRGLAEGDPANPKWRQGLSALTDRIGDLALRTGDRNAALSSYEEGLAALRRLVKDDPNDTRSQRHLAVTLNKIGDLRLSGGDAKAALDPFGEALGVARHLVERDPGNTEWRRDLAICLGKIGDARLANGDLTDAQTAYEDGLRLRRQLAEVEPNDLQAQRDEAVALTRLGGLNLRAKDAKSAADNYRDALKISRTLAAGNPGNLEWQRDVATASSGLGDAANAGGDAAAALAAYKDAQAVMDGLAKRDPVNVPWQTDRALLLTKIALLGDAAAREAGLQQALAILEPLQRDGKLAGPQAGWPDLIRKELAQTP